MNYFKGSSTNIQVTYLEEVDSQNQRQNTTFNAHIYTLWTKHEKKAIGPGER